MQVSYTGQTLRAALQRSPRRGSEREPDPGRCLPWWWIGSLACSVIQGCPRPLTWATVGPMSSQMLWNPGSSCHGFMNSGPHSRLFPDAGSHRACFIPWIIHSRCATTWGASRMQDLKRVGSIGKQVRLSQALTFPALICGAQHAQEPGRGLYSEFLFLLWSLKKIISMTKPDLPIVFRNFQALKTLLRLVKMSALPKFPPTNLDFVCFAY